MIKIKAEGMIVALLHSGEILAFENREEYLVWVKKTPTKKISSLYGNGKIFYDSIQEGKTLMAHMQTFDRDILEEAGIDIDLID